MPNPLLADYIRNNLKLGYSEEQIRSVLVSAGYNIRDIEDTLDAVLRPQELRPLAPKSTDKAEKSIFQKIPLWMIIVSAVGVLLLLVISVVLFSSGGESPAGLLSANGIKVTEYEFSCAGLASSLTITIENVGSEDLSGVQLFAGDVFQAGQLISSLSKGSSAFYSYPDVNCQDWLGEKQIKIVSDKATAEGTIKFICSSGAC